MAPAAHRRSVRRHPLAALFPRTERLADFDVDATPTINPATIATLATGAYLDSREPVVLLGDSGTGKSHLLIGLGIAACEQDAVCVTPPPRNSSSNSQKPPTPDVDVDRDLIRAWWSARCLLNVRWLSEHGFGTFDEFPEVAVLRSAP